MSFIAAVSLVTILQVIPFLILDSSGVDLYGTIGCVLYTLINLVVAPLAAKGHRDTPTTGDYVWHFILGYIPIVFYVNYGYAGKYLARRYL
jgi:hypothetical protein